MEDKIKKFLEIGNGSGYGKGNGYGYGKGNGSGYGNGYGKGNGYGYGKGNGKGNGYGYGKGNGKGNGYGYGKGNGYGYGDGYGKGNGDGDGCRSVNGMDIFKIDRVNTVITNVKDNVAKGFIFNRDLTLTPCFIVKQNDLFAHGETLHKAKEALENKLFSRLDVEERIEEFIKKFSLGVKYPVADFYIWHNRLTGSCEMGRKAFANDHCIDIDHDEMTVEEFINLTKDSFEGRIIRDLAKKIGVEV